MPEAPDHAELNEPRIIAEAAVEDMLERAQVFETDPP